MQIHIGVDQYYKTCGKKHVLVSIRLVDFFILNGLFVIHKPSMIFIYLGFLGGFYVLYHISIVRLDLCVHGIDQHLLIIYIFGKNINIRK